MNLNPVQMHYINPFSLMDQLNQKFGDLNDPFSKLDLFTHSRSPLRRLLCNPFIILQFCFNFENIRYLKADDTDTEAGYEIL